MPVAIGIIIEKLPVASALNKANAEKIINKKAIIKKGFIKKLNQSCVVVKLLPFNYHLIIVAPETLNNAYKDMYKATNKVSFIIILRL